MLLRFTPYLPPKIQIKMESVDRISSEVRVLEQIESKCIPVFSIVMCF